MDFFEFIADAEDDLLEWFVLSACGLPDADDGGDERFLAATSAAKRHNKFYSNYFYFGWVFCAIGEKWMKIEAYIS